MEKKFNLIGILGMVVLAAVSTMGFVRYQRVPGRPSGLAAPALACLPGTSGSDFRSPHFWNGILIPPVDVTGSLDDPGSACLPPGSAAVSQPYQGIPVTGALPVFPQYQYRSANAAASPVQGFQTPPMSDFVPASAVTGFQTPPMSNFIPANPVSGLSGYSRQNELRSLSPGPGLAPHKVLYSGH